ncbi:MAG: glutaminyl-peptide cyclotransferase, partial [Pseudohongiellaceae bacterium]
MKRLIVLALILNALPAMSAAQVPVYGYRVVNSWPHDPTAFTQGLAYRDGFLYEGTGRNGESRLLKRTLEKTDPLLS